jgi:acetyl esterase/lipase
MDTVTSRKHEFAGVDGQPLPLEIYRPDGATGLVPAVLIIEGYPDPGFAAFLGCRFMEMDWSISLARLIGASGLAAVTYANREPVADANRLLEHLATSGATLGIDPGRLGLWATSGHGPLAVSLLHRVGCAVLSNAYTRDIAPATHVADAAATFRFAAPPAPESGVATPMFVIRSGQDEMPGLNESLDRFVARAAALNTPVTVAHHPDAPHSFELFHDSERTREILRQALTFLQCTLAPQAPQAPLAP